MGILFGCYYIWLDVVKGGGVKPKKEWWVRSKKNQNSMM